MRDQIYLHQLVDRAFGCSNFLDAAATSQTALAVFAVSISVPLAALKGDKTVKHGYTQYT